VTPPKLGKVSRTALKYKDNIPLFVEEILNVTPRATQERILNLLTDVHRVCVRSPRGYGKTALASWVVLWALTVFENVKIITTASAWQQLTNGLWTEIANWAEVGNWDKVDLAIRRDKELTKHRLELGSNRFAFAVAPKDPAKIEGTHAEVVVCIIDEGKAVPDDIWDAIEGSFVGAKEYYYLAISTPGTPRGRFYEIHARREGLKDWTPVHVTREMALAEGVPGFKKLMETRKAQWGETAPFFRQQFMAEFAQDEENALIPMDFVEAAIERWYALSDIPNHKRHLEVIGMDVGGEGASSTVIAKLYDGTYISLLEEYKNPDTGANIGILKKVLGKSYNKDKGKYEARANVDVIGIGVGVVDGFRDEEKYNVTGVNVSKPTKKKDATGTVGFYNLRSYLYWRLRERLDPSITPEEELLCLPPDDDLVGELVSIRYRMHANGYKVERKDEIKRRLGKSPDKADSLSLLMYDDSKGARITVYEAENPFFS